MTTSPDRIDPQAQLAELRVDIDRIDAAMHGLLIERSEIIDRLIAIKAAQGGGSAFRPGREAEMMRRLVERHRGRLPLDTVESIWRVIISTFTYLQANYAIHADMAGGDAAMRDSARFHFGFTVPLNGHFGSETAIQAVAAADGDLGMIRVEGHPTRGIWWRELLGPLAPKIIARLPFVERPDHPAGIPVFLVARPGAAAAARDTVIHAVTLAQRNEAVPALIAELGGEIVGNATDRGGWGLLVALPGAVTAQQLAERLGPAADTMEITEVGSHAPRFEVD